MADEQKLATMYVEVRAKTDELQKQLDALKNKTGDTAKQMSSGFSGVTSTLAKLGIGAIGVSGAFNFLKTAVTEARDAQIAFAQVSQAVRQTGGSAGYSAKQLKSFADELEGAVSIDADQILQDVTLQLLTFGKVQGDVFKRAQTAVLDLSAVLGSDLKGQTIQLAKALEDPVRGLTALAKSGITFTEVQKENIKNLIAQNDLYGAQTIILDEINAKYGGQAEALNNADGGLKRFTVTMGNLAEAIGGPILDGLNAMASSISFLLEPTKTFTENLDEATKTSVNTLSSFDNLTYTYLELAKNTNRTETETALFKKTIDELNKIAPNYLKNTNLQTASYSEAETALKNARTQLEAYLDNVISLAIVSDRGAEIAVTYTDLVEARRLLSLLKKDKEEFDKTGKDPFSTRPKETKDKSEVDIYRTANIFTPLDEQIKNVDNTIKNLESKKTKLQTELTDIKKLINEDLTPPVNPVGGTNTEIPTPTTNVDKDLEFIKSITNQLDDLRNKIKLVDDELLKIGESDLEKKIILTSTKESLQQDLNDLEVKFKIKPDEKAAQDFLTEFDAINKKNTDAVSEQSSKYLEEKLAYQLQLQQDYVDAVGLLNDKAYQSEVDRLNAEYEAEIAKYGLTEEAKAVHDEKMLELDKKRQEEEDAITEARLNNIASIADAMNGFSQLSKALGSEDSAAYKAFAITEATIATYLAATKALTVQPPWVGAALAAGTIATGLANVANIVSAHEGGTFQDGKKIASFKQGGAFTVPAGYPNDSFPMLVESGEKVIVVPKNKADKIPQFSDGTDKIFETLNSTFGVNPEVSKNYKTSLSVNTVTSNNNIDVVNAIGALNRNISNLDRKVIELDIDGKNLAKIVLGTINDMQSAGYDTSLM